MVSTKSRAVIGTVTTVASAVVFTVLGVSRADAQTPVRREIRQQAQGVVLDFRQDGVWRRRVREIAALRAQRRAGAPPGAEGPVAQGVFIPSVTGVLSVPAIFFRYQDQGTGTVHAIGDLETSLFGQTPPAGLPYTIRTFYDEMSGGAFRIEGQAIGWLTLDNAEETYTGVPGTCFGNPTGTANCNGIFSNAAIASLHTGLAEAIAKADPSIDFGNFDNDGPDGVPNSGDDDGVVDLAAFYHSELDGSCGGPTNNHIWAHRFSLSTAAATNDARTGGGVIMVSDYVVQGGVGGSSGCTASLPVAIGTSTHEFGHGLGLPDLYDTSGPTEGIGQWGLMGSGNHTTQPSPSRMSAVSLNEMGWITMVDVTASMSLVLPPITTSRTAYAIRVQDPNPRGEYFVIENRQGTLSDSAMIRIHCVRSGFTFPSTCAGGLAVWHVDSLKIVQSMFTNTVNSGSIHGVALAQADGNGDLDAGSNRGDGGDVWPGTSGASTFDVASNPAAVKNSDGSWVGFDLTSITQVTPNGTVSLDVAFASPIVLSVAPSTFADSAVEGSTTLIAESATVSLTGTGSGTTSWTASAGGAAWITPTIFAGTGSGPIQWSRDPTGLSAGAYVATISVTAAGATGSPANIVDTLLVLPDLVMSVTPKSRSDTTVAGSTAAILDSANVSFTGTGAASATWTATHGSGAWLTVTTPNGTGAGVVVWNRDPTGLGAGTYVDTVTVTSVTAQGSPDTVVDTLVVLPALVMNLDPVSRSDTVIGGSTVILSDSADVSFAGTGASTAPWAATHGAGSWLNVTTPTGTSDGVVRWSRDPTGLNTGVYVDTVTVTSAGAVGSPDAVIDTLVVLPSLSLSLMPSGRSVSVIEGAAVVADSGTVSLAGTGSAGASWSAAHGGAAWVTLTTSSGTGSGIVRWSRNPAGLVPGTYIDTITVTSAGAVGSPAVLIDTLQVTQRLVLSVSPQSSIDSVSAGATNAPGGAVSITITGTGAGQAQWNATHGGAAWLTLGQVVGVGSGATSWSRDPSGLTVGVYVDTVTVTVAGATGSPAIVVDTLKILLPLTISVEPSGQRVSAVSGTGVSPLDSARVVLDGTDAAATVWIASSGATWSTFNRLTGTGSGHMRWTRDASVLTPGIYVDSITVVAGEVTSQFLDTLEVTQAVISADDVIRELLEGSTLADVHKRYLDSLGNRDGIFNLGDVLAHLDRLGTILSPELRDRLIGDDSPAIRPRVPGGAR